MKINNQNIVAYINFLYQRKHGTDAPKDILNSWEGLDDTDALKNLKDLYQYWTLSEQDAAKFEQEFLSASTKKPIFPDPAPEVRNTPPPLHAPEQPRVTNHVAPVYNEPPVPKRSRGNGVLIGLLLVLLAGGGYYIWQLKNQNNAVPADVAATNDANLAKDTATPEPSQVKPDPLPVTDADKTNARVIMDLQDAETEQDFNKIYSFFDPNMERYWSINYPTYDELLEAYQKNWAIASDIKHADVKIDKVSDNTYDVSETYSYFSSKTNSVKTLHPITRFVFNDAHKIIKTYGL